MNSPKPYDECTRFDFQDAEVFHACLPNLSNVRSLDLGDNQFDGDEGLLLLLEGIRGHVQLDTLVMDQVFLKSSLVLGAKSKDRNKARPGTIDSLMVFDIKDLCVLLTPPGIKTLNLANNQLKAHLDSVFTVLENALEPEHDFSDALLSTLNIQGNGIGDHGAFNVAKMLCNNKTVEDLQWDENGVSLIGWTYIASSLTR
jgi:hypothetical protein